MKYIILLASLLFTSFIVNAQHGVSYNQFGQLRNTFNSSLSTMDLQGSISMLGRSQWTGVQGAPTALWANGNVGFQKARLSLGVDIRHASLGVSKQNELAAYAAKAIRISENEYISLSLGGGVMLFQANYSALDDQGDPAFRENIRETEGFLSIGASVYSPERYYVGISMPRFALGNNKNVDEFKNVYYITAGALFRLDDAFHLRPSLLLSHMDERDTFYDLNAMMFICQKMGLGMGVQNQGNLSALMQINFGKFAVGYSYQFGTKYNPLKQNIATNTHEIGLRYRVQGIGLL